jgi:hypothetical protein
MSAKAVLSPTFIPKAWRYSQFLNRKEGEYRANCITTKLRIAFHLLTVL